MTTEEIYNTHLDIEQPRTVKRSLKELAIDHTRVTVEAMIGELESVYNYDFEYLTDTKLAIYLRIEQLKKELNS